MRFCETVFFDAETFFDRIDTWPNLLGWPVEIWIKVSWGKVTVLKDKNVDKSISNKHHNYLTFAMVESKSTLKRLKQFHWICSKKWKVIFFCHQLKFIIIRSKDGSTKGRTFLRCLSVSRKLSKYSLLSNFGFYV